MHDGVDGMLKNDTGEIIRIHDVTIHKVPGKSIVPTTTIIVVLGPRGRPDIASNHVVSAVHFAKVRDEFLADLTAGTRDQDATDLRGALR